MAETLTARKLVDLSALAGQTKPFDAIAKLTERLREEQGEKDINESSREYEDWSLVGNKVVGSECVDNE